MDCRLYGQADPAVQSSTARFALCLSAATVVKWCWMADLKIRVLVAKPGLDGHDRGAKVIARALRDAGMEVIYTGLRQTPEMIVNAALQEDVQVIGLSILSGAHNAIVPRVMDLLKKNKMDDVIVVLGGIIPSQDIEGMKQLGVAAIFQPGTTMDDIVQFIRTHVKGPGVPAAG
jgi:methylmalonyl-CoA mutase C-terminal domain/subunit